MAQPGLRENAREFDFTDADFRFIAEVAYRNTGISLGEKKRDMVYGRIVKRLRQLGFDSFSAYCELLAGPEGEGEIGNLVNAITTNLSGFFRESHHFEHLKEHVLAPLAGLHKPPRVRIWSAACSWGAEPYSIAMTACDALPKVAEWDFKILATDIDTNMLGQGEQGRYSDDQADKIPHAQRLKYTLPVKNEGIVMDDKLKKLIAFKPLNLTGNWPFKGPFHAIFCRNVVIYFDKPTQKILFDRLADMLVPGGMLYIGHSETLHGISARFELTGKTMYRKLK